MNTTGNANGVQAKTSKGVSIRAVIFSLMMVGAMGPLVVYEALTYANERSSIQSSIELKLKDEGRINATKVADWIDQQRTFVRVLANGTVLRSGDIPAIEGYLAEANSRVKEYYGMALMDPTGQQIARSKGNKVNVADRPYFKEAIAGADSVVGTGISRVTSTAAFFVSAPVREYDAKGLVTGTPVGVLSALAELSVVSNGVTGGKIGQTGFSYLVDSETLEVMAHPDAKKVAAKLDDSQKSLLGKESLGSVREVMDASGKPVKVVAHKAGGSLVLITQIDTAEVNAPLSAIKSQALIFIGAGFLVALGFAFALSSSIATKIKRLSKITADITRARSIQDIVRAEQAVSSVGGASELREMGLAIRKLTGFIKSAMRSPNKTSA